MTNHEGDPGSEGKPVNYENLSNAEFFLMRGRLMHERGVEPVEAVDEAPVADDNDGYFPPEFFQGE